MRKDLLNYIVEAGAVNAPKNGVEIDLLKLCGGIPDSLSFQLTVTGASTPNTANFQVQGSLDGVNWTNVGSAVNVVGNAVLFTSVDRPAYTKFRVVYAIASGSYNGSLRVLGIG